MTGRKSRGMNADVLRLIALAFMLLDHLWATLIPGNLWMTCLGRLAFPIFAFQAAEGFLHTSDLKRYRQRLLLFAVLSEIPFNLLQSGSLIFPFHQNVMFTLLLGLLAIKGVEKAQRERTIRAVVLGTLILLGCLLLGVVGFVDYGAMGVVTVVLFYLLRNFRGWQLAQLVAMVLLNVVFFDGQSLAVTETFFFPVQGFAVLSLPLIWLYNGKKGRGGKTLKYGSYLFYPVHMLLIYLIWSLL